MPTSKDNYDQTRRMDNIDEILPRILIMKEINHPNIVKVFGNRSRLRNLKLEI